MEKPKWCGLLLPISVVMIVGVVRFELGGKQGTILDYDFQTRTLCDRAVEIDPQDALDYYNRGVAKFESGDKKGAILDFNRAITIDPQDAESYTNRGAVKLALGDKQGAIADLTKGAELFRQQGKMADYQKIIELIRQFKQSGGSVLPLSVIVTAISVRSIG
jgi:tetratricopeptide (TPR) repeat protein